MNPKEYAYVFMHGAVGAVVRGHSTQDRPNEDPNFLTRKLQQGFVPLREVVLPNSSVILVLGKDPEMMRSSAPAKRRSKASPAGR